MTAAPLRAADGGRVGRVTQGERSRLMRARLLDACVEVLVERGFTGTTTTLVSERAGVSRGAQLHHFPTRNDLVFAAVEHVMTRRAAELEVAGEQLPTGKRRTRAVLELFADHFTSPMFTAALELWVGARTDAELLALVGPFEQQVGRGAHRLAVRLLDVDESVAGQRELIQATLDLIRGLGLAATISDDAARRARILDNWAAVLDSQLAHPSNELTVLEPGQRTASGPVSRTVSRKADPKETS